MRRRRRGGGHRRDADGHRRQTGDRCGTVTCRRGRRPDGLLEAPPPPPLTTTTSKPRRRRRLRRWRAERPETAARRGARLRDSGVSKPRNKWAVKYTDRLGGSSHRRYLRRRGGRRAQIQRGHHRRQADGHSRDTNPSVDGRPQPKPVARDKSAARPPDPQRVKTTGSTSQYYGPSGTRPTALAGETQRRVREDYLEQNVQRRGDGRARVPRRGASLWIAGHP